MKRGNGKPCLLVISKKNIKDILLQIQRNGVTNCSCIDDKSLEIKWLSSNEMKRPNRNILNITAILKKNDELPLACKSYMFSSCTHPYIIFMLQSLRIWLIFKPTMARSCLLIMKSSLKLHRPGLSFNILI